MIFDKLKNLKKTLGGTETTAAGGVKLVSSPMTGEVLPLAESSDPVHQQEMLGKGAIIIPSE